MNITAVDLNGIDSIWYEWNGENLTYSAPLFLNFSEGLNVLHVWANDTANNVGSESVSLDD